MLTVHNFLQMDSIGQDPQLIEQADFQLPMCMEKGLWKIKLDKLP